jgi:hypothetical protein
MTPVAWLWVVVFGVIAVFGAVVTWRSLARVWAGLTALAAEAADAFDRLGAAARVLDGIGRPVPFERTAGQRGALLASDRSAPPAALPWLDAAKRG